MQLSSILDLLFFILIISLIAREMYRTSGKKNTIQKTKSNALKYKDDLRSSTNKVKFVGGSECINDKSMMDSKFGGATFCNTPADTYASFKADMWD